MVNTFSRAYQWGLSDTVVHHQVVIISCLLIFYNAHILHTTFPPHKLQMEKKKFFKSQNFSKFSANLDQVSILLYYQDFKFAFYILCQGLENKHLCKTYPYLCPP